MEFDRAQNLTVELGFSKSGIPFARCHTKNAGKNEWHHWDAETAQRLIHELTAARQGDLGWRAPDRVGPQLLPPGRRVPLCPPINTGAH